MKHLPQQNFLLVLVSVTIIFLSYFLINSSPTDVSAPNFILSPGHPVRYQNLEFRVGKIEKVKYDHANGGSIVSSLAAEISIRDRSKDLTLIDKNQYIEDNSIIIPRFNVRVNKVNPEGVFLTLLPKTQ
jgi:hypothetical protein